MKNLTTNVTNGLAWAGGALMLLCAILVSLDVLTRKLLGSTFFESFELSTYAFAIMVSFGCAYALMTKAHIRIEVLYRLLPGLLQRILDIVSVLGLLICAVVLFWFAWVTFADSWVLGAKSNSPLGVPLVIPQGIWMVGFAWFAISCAVLFVLSLVNFVKGRHDKVETDVGIVTLEEEIDASTADQPIGEAR